MIPQLAWKNVWRNKVRSTIILTTIMLGLTAGVFAVAFMNGMVNQKVEDTINIELTHLQINTQKFIDDGEIEAHFAGLALEQQIRDIPQVTGVSPRIVLTAMAASPHKTGGAQVVGIVPEKEKEVSQLYRHIPDTLGNYFAEDLKNSIVVGQKFTEKYRVGLQSKIVLSFVNLDGEQVSAAFRICGIFHTNNPLFYEIKMFIRARDARALTGMAEGDIHEMAVQLSDNEDITVAKSQPLIKAKLQNGVTVRNWKEISPLMELYTGFVQIELMLIVAIILIALGFGIVNTILMSVLERRLELNMLMAIGMNRKKVMQLIITESSILTMFGGFAGMLTGLFIIWITGKTGIDMSATYSSYQTFGISTLIHPLITGTQFVVIATMVVATGILSALLPARTAISKQPYK